MSKIVLAKAAIIFLFLSYILDPSGSFGLKYPLAFFGCLLSVCFIRGNFLEIVGFLVYFLYVLSYPILSSIFLQIDVGSALSQVIFIIYGLVFFPARFVSRYDAEDGFSNLLGFMFLLPILMVLSYQIAGLFGLNIYNLFTKFFITFDYGFFGIHHKEEYAGSFSNAYFRWSGLFIFIFGFYLIQNQVGRATGCFMAVLATTSFGIIFFTSVFYFIHSFIFKYKSYSRFVVVLIFLSLLPIVSDVILYKFSFEDASANVKIGHVLSFYEHFSSLSQVFIGDGFGSRFYTAGFDNFTVETEISILNMLRQGGIFFTVPFFFIIGWLIFKSIRVGRTTDGLLVFIIFLFTATNPLLMSPLFVFVYVFTLVLVLDHHDKGLRSSINV